MKSKKQYLLLIFSLLFIILLVNRHKIRNLFFAKKVVTEKHKINPSVYENAELVTIPSYLNNEPQKAFLFKSKQKSKQPLVISLHTWGGTYKQEDSVLTIVKKYDWNYIHPDYGGQQWLKNSCCFDASISYIDEAIDYAINRCLVDTSKIIIIGKSGGGSGVLASLLKSKYDNLHYMCWSPITDYISWHKEVQKNDDLKKRYFNKIMQGTNSIDVLDTNNAKLKSPYYFEFKKVKNNNYKNITIYVGIRDGLDGWSTSISQPINFYNKLLQEINCKDTSCYITRLEHEKLLEKRENISTNQNKKIGTRNIVYSKWYKNIKIIFFSGGHEILLDAVDKEFKSFI